VGRLHRQHAGPHPLHFPAQSRRSLGRANQCSRRPKQEKNFVGLLVPLHAIDGSRPQRGHEIEMADLPAVANQDRTEARAGIGVFFNFHKGGHRHSSRLMTESA
jgi:hypothetical protein